MGIVISELSNIMGISRQYFHDLKPPIIAMTALLTLAAAGPVMAIEQVLDDRSSTSLIGTGGALDTAFGFPDIIIAVLRVVTVVFALFMAATAVHGWVLGKHHGGSMDGKKVADGTFRQGARGFVVAVALAAIAKPLVLSVFGLAGMM
jgi:hypothetical protein